MDKNLQRKHKYSYFCNFSNVIGMINTIYKINQTGKVIIDVGILVRDEELVDFTLMIWGCSVSVFRGSGLTSGEGWGTICSVGVEQRMAAC